MIIVIINGQYLAKLVVFTSMCYYYYLGINNQKKRSIILRNNISNVKAKIRIVIGTNKRKQITLSFKQYLRKKNFIQPKF